MVVERHQCANGVQDQLFFYLGSAGFDPSTVLPGRAAQINATLAAIEASANMAADSAPVSNEQTVAAFLVKLRAAYRSASKGDACQIAWWVLRRIAQGQLTDAQFQAAFGVTATQWTNFKTNTLTPQSNAWAGVIAAAGS